MIEITAPNHPMDEEYDAYWPTMFVAGGITGCPDWQAMLIEAVDDVEGLAFNPRRPEFDVRDPDATEDQIAWEAKYLEFANAISFWFPRDSLCPITLYELGSWTPTVSVPDPEGSGFSMPVKKQLFIGVDPEYARRADVEIQTRRKRPELEIVYSIQALADQIRLWAAKDERPS